MKKILALMLLTISLMLTGCEGENSNGDELVPVTPDVSDEKIVYEATDNINVVSSLKDEITADSAWCATFQLVWNDLKNEYVKQDIAIPNKMAENLNQETFTDDMISDEYYYKTWGLQTLEKKAEIEKGIADKFDETSDVLDLFDWYDLPSEKVPELIFYTMLKREFEYPKEFSKLEEGTFADKYENVKYFGIDGKTNEAVDSQVKVLFYNSEDEYAVSLKTKSGDEVILYKDPTGKTFGEIYSNLANKTNSYKGEKEFNKIDQLKVPYVTMDELREYNEFVGIPFGTASGEMVQIEKAVQTIKFDIDEKGGKIKSEAALSVTKDGGIVNISSDKPRYFYFDDTFAMFLKEESKDMPYFGILIDDITKYQD